MIGAVEADALRVAIEAVRHRPRGMGAALGPASALVPHRRGALGPRKWQLPLRRRHDGRFVSHNDIGGERRSGKSGNENEGNQ
jgi:hypothetical protein